MGDAGRNMEAVGKAVECLTDRERLSMAQAKICISTGIHNIIIYII